MTRLASIKKKIQTILPLEIRAWIAEIKDSPGSPVSTKQWGNQPYHLTRSGEAGNYKYYVYCKDDESLLGSGGFGRVYLGMMVDPENGEVRLPVAIKEIDMQQYVGKIIGKKVPQTTTLTEVQKAAQEMVAQAAAQEMVAQEATLNRRLHRTDKPVLRKGKDENLAIVVSEYIEGVDVHKAIMRKRTELSPYFSPLLQANIIWQGLLDLNALHKHKHPEAPISHGDLKPENLMVSVDDEGRVHGRIIDLGYAQRVPISPSSDINQDISDITFTKNIRGGTRQYYAPEIQNALRDNQPYKISLKSDIWAYGIIMMEVLMPDVHWEAHDELLANLQYLSLPAEVKPMLVAFITRMMSDNPEDRPDSDECLAFSTAYRNYWVTAPAISSPVSADYQQKRMEIKREIQQLERTPEQVKPPAEALQKRDKLANEISAEARAIQDKIDGAEKRREKEKAKFEAASGIPQDLNAKTTKMSEEAQAIQNAIKAIGEEIRETKKEFSGLKPKYDELAQLEESMATKQTWLLDKQQELAILEQSQVITAAHQHPLLAQMAVLALKKSEKPYPTAFADFSFSHEDNAIVCKAIAMLAENKCFNAKIAAALLPKKGKQEAKLTGAQRHEEVVKKSQESAASQELAASIVKHMGNKTLRPKFINQWGEDENAELQTFSAHLSSLDKPVPVLHEKFPQSKIDSYVRRAQVVLSAMEEYYDDRLKYREQRLLIQYLVQQLGEGRKLAPASSKYQSFAGVLLGILDDDAFWYKNGPVKAHIETTRAIVARPTSSLFRFFADPRSLKAFNKIFPMPVQSAAQNNARVTSHP